MKRIFFAAMLLVSVIGAMGQSKKSDEAQYLLDYLNSIYGEKIISGVTACVNWNTNEALWVYQHTGRWPGINQFDFIHHVYSKPGSWIDYSNPSVAIDWARNGGIVAAMWHWGMKSNDGTTWTCTPGDKPGETNFHPSCVRDPNSEGYRQMVKDIDIICGYLKPLKEEGIPVLWRPFHEAQGNWTEQYPGVDWHKAWFWWGIDGPEVLVDLWHFLYDRMVNVHGLDNLIWVFNVGDSYRWYPGDEYVDIVANDLYNVTATKMTVHARDFKQKSEQYKGKLIAMAECGTVAPMKKFFDAGSRYLYYCTWYDHARTNNINSAEFKSEEHNNMNKAEWEKNIAEDIVLMRDDLPCFLKTIQTPITVWVGESKQSWNSAGMLKVKSDVLKDANEGDYLHFTLSEDNNGWITFYTYPGKTQIASNDFPEDNGFHPSANGGRLRLTAELIRKLKNGFYLYGGGYTVTSIELLTNVPNPDFPSNIATTRAVNYRAGIYNLAGQKCKDMSKPGIYVVDGKKVMVK